jgi:hypothetical protein
MKFLLVNRHFGDQQVPTARMLADVAAELRAEDHTVVVLTSQSSYAKKTAESITARDTQIRFLYTPGETHRLLSWIAFWTQALVVVPWMRWDRVLLLTDPPFLVVISRIMNVWPFRRRGVYWWTMDLYPEALVAQGMIRSGGLADRLLRWLVDLSISTLAGVISLGEEQTRRLRSHPRWKEEADFCLVQPPWDSRPLAFVERHDNRFLLEHGLEDKKLALYAGNLGMAHSYVEILDVARMLALEGDREWTFVFVVRGSQRDQLEADAANIPNVTILDYQREDMTADLMWAADVHLITMKPGWEGVVVPSKLYGVMKTAAPVLYIGPSQSDTARTIVSLGGGSVAPNGVSSRTLAATLRNLGGQINPPRRTEQLDGASSIAAFLAS